MRVYIACGLTHVPRDLFAIYVAFIHELASELAKQRSPREVKYALAHSDPLLATKPWDERARLCYLWDRDMVEEADVVVAEASFPATGLGIELQMAGAKNTPIIICFRDFGANKATPVSYENPDHSSHNLQIGRGFVSLMALGLPSVFRVVQYVSPEDGVRKISELLELVERN